jgi:hypothetical protein
MLGVSTVVLRGFGSRWTASGTAHLQAATLIAIKC